MPASATVAQTSSSLAPSKTGVATWIPNWRAAIPKCNSNTCPMFIREGTPNGFNMISTGVPSGKKGMSSSGIMRETTPLFP